jgi:hypothetical protein
MPIDRLPDIFYRMDFVRVALQQRGAGVKEIDFFLASLEKASSSPEAFKAWNRKLDDKEVKVLALMLTPSGRPLVQALLDGLLQETMTRLNISAKDIEEHLRSIGLN